MCYLVGMICKSFKNEKLDTFIPDIVGVVGAILGIVIYLTIPNFIPADNWAVAIAIGIVSGLSATGINQIYKQFAK
jgi:fluoride ion exporter CrcB/FEX